MVRVICAGVMLMWCLTPSGALAWPVDTDVRSAAGPVAGQGNGPVSPYLDPATGTVLTLSRQGNGAVRLQASIAGLEVTKVVTPGGVFDLRLVTPDDDVRLLVNKNRLMVSRRNKKAVFDADAVDDLSLQRMQVVLAGSGAVRQFRQVFSHLSETTLVRPEGIALATIETILGWLQGDVEAVRRNRRPSAVAPRAYSALDEGEKEQSCYEVWEAEVIDAWNDYESCVYAFEWWNPAREVCAFLWVIRAESAWFTLIGCSAIPIKLEA